MIFCLFVAVVALLNAIKAQQAMLADDEPAGPSSTAGKSAVKDMPQESFLTLLKKAAKSTTPSTATGEALDDGEAAPAHAGKAAATVSAAPKRKWAVLDDEYMMTAKAKDWAKADSDGSGSGEEFSDDSDDSNDD